MIATNTEEDIISPVYSTCTHLQ